MGIASLWRAPPVNPINHKAQAVPVLNPMNIYGRTFFFSTMGFMIAFMSWYAWTPLVSFHRVVSFQNVIPLDQGANSDTTAI